MNGPFFAVILGCRIQDKLHCRGYGLLETPYVPQMSRILMNAIHSLADTYVDRLSILQAARAGSNCSPLRVAHCLHSCLLEYWKGRLGGGNVEPKMNDERGRSGGWV